MARIQLPPRWLWWTSNVPPSAICRTGAIISMAHLKCLQHWLETIQSIGRHHPPQLHTDNFPPHLGDLPFATHKHDLSRQRNRAGERGQGLPSCPHYQIFLMTNSIQMLSTMIRWTQAGRKAKPQLAWIKQNSPWSNLLKGWGSPTLVHSTSGRKYGWLGFSRRSICLLSRDRTIWNSCTMDPCAGRWWLVNFLETFETWLPLENFHNAEWIQRQWVDMFLKKCASEVLEARKKGRWGNKRPATDLGQRAGKKVRGNIP